MTGLSLSVSLVLYKPDLAILEKTLVALQLAVRIAKSEYELQVDLALVDNSCDAVLHQQMARWLQDLQPAMPDLNVTLHLSSGNVGYGRGNNLVIERVQSDYHLVINPDLFVFPEAILEALRFLQSHPDTGLLTPAVFGEGGERHYLCKRHPTLLIMFLRSSSFKWLESWFSPVLEKFEMRDCDYEKPIFDVEYPTGACMFFRTSVLKKIKGFDPDYFLHYEDADIGRRVLQVARVIYVPQVRVIHKWARDTHRSWRARLTTVRSGLIYWRKWGGIFTSKPGDRAVAGEGGGPGARSPETAQPTTGLSHARRRVLVTGATGFVGSAVCADFPQRGWDVRALVRQQPEARFESDVELVSIPGMNEQTDWSDALRGVDCVVHLAARVHLMQETSQDPLAEYRRANVSFTLNLARQAAAAGIRRFVFASSIKVNGEVTPVGQPFTPDDVPHPTDPYGVSKLEAEQALLALSAQTALDVVIVRPVLVYGPGVKANFSSMMHWLMKGVPLPLGSLHNRRSFIALDNLVDLLATCVDHPAASKQVFLASDGEDLSVPELLRRAGKALGKRAVLMPVPVTALKVAARVVGQEAVMHRLSESLQVDISKTRRLLNWTPPVRIDAALQKTAEQFRRDKA